MKPLYILNTDELELLLAFETADSLEKLSKALGKDISNISRSLAKIADKAPVVEKQNNRWKMTELGKKLNQHSHDSIFHQNSLFNQTVYLKIGTNREFASRILGPSLKDLYQILPNTLIRICAYENGVEQALLNSLIDIGIDCERPFSPDISFKHCWTEELVPVCSPDFKNKYLKKQKEQSLFEVPHLLCDRLLPSTILKMSENNLNVVASFNDIATTRATCLTGLGWALLPKYSVSSEIEQKKLVTLKFQKIEPSRYGIWWLRNRKKLAPTVITVKSWLDSLKL